MPLSLFNPSPADSDRVMNALCDPLLSFQDAARHFNTTVHALSIWIATPEIALRFTEIREACAARTRLLAAMSLSDSVAVLNQIIEEYANESQVREMNPYDPSSPATVQRQRESARRAIALLQRLSRHTDAVMPIAAAPAASSSSSSAAQLAATAASRLRAESVEHQPASPATPAGPPVVLGYDAATASSPSQEGGREGLGVGSLSAEHVLPRSADRSARELLTKAGTHRSRDGPRAAVA